MRNIFLGLGVAGFLAGAIISAPPLLSEGRLTILGVLLIFVSLIIIIITKVFAR
jgi:hypothetical protein